MAAVSESYEEPWEDDIGPIEATPNYVLPSGFKREDGEYVPYLQTLLWELPPSDLRAAANIDGYIDQISQGQAFRIVYARKWTVETNFPGTENLPPLRVFKTRDQGDPWVDDIGKIEATPNYVLPRAFKGTNGEYVDNIKVLLLDLPPSDLRAACETDPYLYHLVMDVGFRMSYDLRWRNIKVDVNINDSDFDHHFNLFKARTMADLRGYFGRRVESYVFYTLQRELARTGGPKDMGPHKVTAQSTMEGIAKGTFHSYDIAKRRYLKFVAYPYDERVDAQELSIHFMPNGMWFYF